MPRDSLQNDYNFAERLLAWHAEHGRHDLPWQHPRTPYRVWLSEIMLQQTQVTTVIPYFTRFLEQFPDIEHLARADEDAILSHWSGLGYYARARNLHKASQQILEQHHGQFPENFDSIIALPGIGRSTANAILAQAFATPAPILDGNVKRILARQIALEQPPATAMDTLWQAAKHRTPPHSAANYTQAIMDLGALICTRSRPRCLLCPISESCIAHQQGRTDVIPAKTPKREKPRRAQDFYLYQRTRDKAVEIWLEKRPSKGIWGGLWSLPEQPMMAFAKQCNPEPLPRLQHQFTHFHLTLQPLRCPLPDGTSNLELPNSDIAGWFTIEAALKKGLPAPIKTIIENTQSQP